MKKSGFFTMFLVSLIAVGVLCGCKKEGDKIRIEGNVSDAVRKIPVPGTEVYLYGKVIQGGVFNPSPAIIAQGVTDESGHFIIDHPQVKANDYELVYQKEGYFDERESLTDQQLSSGKAYETDMSLQPEAWLKLKVQNTNPFNSSDLISYRIISSNPVGSDCCNSDYVQGTGTSYNVESVCKTTSQSPVTILWNVHKGPNHKLDSVTLITPLSDTLFYHLTY